MSAVADKRTVFEGWIADRQDAPPPSTGLPWLETARREARERVKKLGVPTGREEAWRYTGLRPLTAQHFTPFGETGSAVSAEDLQGLLIPGLEAHRAVLVNGRFMPQLSDLDGLPSGARAGGLRDLLASDPEALEGLLNHVAGQGAHVFSALNTAGLDDGFVLLLPEGARLDRPVEVIHLSAGADEPRVAQPRHLIALERGAEARVIERCLGLNNSLYCTNALLEVTLGQNAALDHTRLQTESPNAFHITGIYVRQGSGSRYRGRSLGLGAAWARTDLVVRLEGERSETDLEGLYLAGDGQLSDYHLDLDHRVPACASRENFKGILQGRGRAVFDGRIHVARDAQKTDAHLSNRNLLLSRNAEVDTKPQLEIHADDVKCSHGATVGQIEPEALFYLRSRGIPEPRAKRMLCMGFAEEIIDAVEPEPLRAYAADEVGRRLGDAGSL